MKTTTKPNFKLVGQNGELLVAIGLRSWHVLDESRFFSSGVFLRKAFGTDFVAGLFKKPQDGILKTISAFKFCMYCKAAWVDLVRDQDLLSYSYSYKFERENGRTHGGGMSGFKVNEYHGSVSVRPAGYCTVELMQMSPSGRGRVVEIIDLRVIRQIQTDDRGYLRMQRRKMEIDWYHEMPRILEFCEQNKKGDIKVMLV